MPNLTNDFKGLKISVEEATADMTETARELESDEMDETGADYTE